MKKIIEENVVINNKTCYYYKGLCNSCRIRIKCSEDEVYSSSTNKEPSMMIHIIPPWYYTLCPRCGKELTVDVCSEDEESDVNDLRILNKYIGIWIIGIVFICSIFYLLIMF